MNILRRISVFISWILHPLLIPTYTFIILFSSGTYFNLSIPDSLKWFICSLVFFVTYVLPGITVFGLMRAGFLKSMHMDDKEERQLPFLITAIYYIVCYYMFRQLRLPNLFVLIMIGASATIIAALIINFKWKISIHMIGMGGLSGIIFALSRNGYADLYTLFLIAILLSGITGTARLIAGNHSQKQIYIGFIIGFFVEFLILGK